ncbi:putative uncharacterized protein DDB_G0282133 isoform X6 [Nymphalis io]|uniref:putative uncharacterized protein DDB_G0282133 isoform X1 n=1 Tax=Inachis io TaxID=171585 RepID=UPI0021676CCC|nr:putative uncharacterized protein DDB_G0282133 isoform X1 [Nymphalis io]XP_050359671.1 putative uncharacterized protein DDB_G0282133 isoform X5 [Nymphalis io]XP_050359672.1 putative uncharacterized protein DDB_G0282133 isoform X6 [Nymphalis io]
MMAPPKYPPKKNKPKGKENTVANAKDKKRPSEHDNEASVKRGKTDNNDDTIKASTSKTKLKPPNKVNAIELNVTKAKKTNDLQLNDIEIDDNASKDKVEGNPVNAGSKTSNEVLISKSNSSNAKKEAKMVADSEKSNVNVASTKNANKNDNTDKNNSNKTKKVATDKNIETVNKKDGISDVNKKAVDKIKTLKTKSKTQDGLQVKKAKLTETESMNTVDKSKHIKKVNTDKTKYSQTNDVTKSNNEAKNLNPNRSAEKKKEKNLAERFSKNKIVTNKNVNEKINNKISLNNKSKAINKINKIVSGKTVDTNSKIPQKRPSSENIKKNPLRISPRKPQSNMAVEQDSSKSSVKSLQKPVTNIPRLLKKPLSKPKPVT